MDSDLDSDNSVFDVKSPTRENGSGSGGGGVGGSGRRSSATTNNNTTVDMGGNDLGATTKAVRSNSENTGENCEKTCLTTMSGSSIA